MATIFSNKLIYTNIILNMPKEITTYPATADALREFLEFFLDLCEKQNILELSLLYGFAWGNEIYNWQERLVKTGDVIPDIKNVEEITDGAFGEDDLSFRIPGKDITLKFCHHSDIHFTFEKNDPLASECFRKICESFRIASEKEN